MFNRWLTEGILDRRKAEGAAAEGGAWSARDCAWLRVTARGPDQSSISAPGALGRSPPLR